MMTREAVVVKVGGGLLASEDALSQVLVAVTRAGGQRPVLVVPGGGPFADAVREVDARMGLSARAAHWMAILAMDQYAWLLHDRLPGSRLARTARAARTAVRTSGVTVLAPFAWLRAADPLPHGWDVTSDSLAAWMTGALGVGQLVLVKPPGASGEAALDPAFARSLPVGVHHVVVAADDGSGLAASLGGEVPDA